MTGAGLALIAGGLATLISFRSILFGGGERGGKRGGERGSRRRAARGIEAPRKPAALPAARTAGADAADDDDPGRGGGDPALPADPALAGPDRLLPGAGAGEPARRGRRGRRRAAIAASAGREAPWESDQDDRGGLASIGLADEDENEDDAREAGPDGDAEGDHELGHEADDEPDPVAARADRYGDRVEGWVRPEYQDPPDEPRPGEYWTPIPVGLAGDPEPSAKGYGWPRPVERLPAVPDYEPATGFDLVPISEPTEVVPTWAMNDDRPGRIRLPRSWNTRNERHPEKPEPRRPRPRPRPRPQPPVDSSTVYVSRHAADPPPRRD
jgi:hypothetical protein